MLVPAQKLRMGQVVGSLSEADGQKLPGWQGDTADRPDEAQKDPIVHAWAADRPVNGQ